jgi:dipeptidyl aminopeptidase/acylaminoacyl peptidase
MRFDSFLLSALLSVLPGAAVAADAIPAANFARHADYSGAEISPNGEYVSVVTPFEDRSGLSIIKLSGKFDRLLIKFPDGKKTVADSYWTDDSRLVVAQAVDIGSLASPLLNGTIYGVDADSGKQQQLFGYQPDDGGPHSRFKDEGVAFFMQTIPGTKGEALFYFLPWTRGSSDYVTSIFRVDTYTGRRTQIESIKDNVSVSADTAGVPRFISGEDMTGNPWLRYRPTAGAKDWLPVPKSLTGHTMSLDWMDPDNNRALAWISDKGEASQLYRVDLAAGTRERLGGNDDITASDELYAGFGGPPFALIYRGAKPRVEYLDPTSEWAKLHAGLMKLFPGQLVYFTSFTRDNKKVLFYVYGDRNPGAYYIFDRATNTPAMLFQTQEWIDPSKMAPTRPVEFKNAGGQTLYGFLTTPQGKTGPAPLVVMPHGGPFGVNDEWGYDSDAQFLASRGYSVLQVNYRGSGGRGETFERSTFKQWGTGIQQDIADGVRWAIAQNVADKGRVCIFGASFGGYSALMNPMLNPGMYRCAIGYAGVYDLVLEKKMNASGESKQTNAWMDRALGSDPAMLAEQSPVTQVARLDVPVLFIHGRSDHTAPIEQFNAMEAAMKKAKKPYETLIKANEGHGFYDVKNRTEVYERMEAFLRKYNPPD